MDQSGLYNTSHRSSIECISVVKLLVQNKFSSGNKGFRSFRCSIGLKSEEFEGQVNTLNLLCYANHSLITIFAWWQGALSH